MSTEKQATPKIVYKVEGDYITREDTEGPDGIEVVAKYDPKAGVIELNPGYEKYKTAIIRHLNNKGHKFTEVGQIGMNLQRPGVPPKPRKSMLQGEKTPVLVEWYAKYHPQVFLAKYQVRQKEIRVGYREEEYIERDRETGRKTTRTREVPIYEKVEGMDYELEKLKTGEQRLIADCQTHITVKADETDESGEYDHSLDEAITSERGGTI